MRASLRPIPASRLLLLLAAALCLVAVLAPLTQARTSAPVAHAAKTCAVDADSGSVTSGYITSVKATGTSCATGIKVAKSYNSCRIKKSLKGKCTSKVRKYSCKENKRVTTQEPPEIDGRVTCKKGSAKVVLTYQTLLDS